MFKFITALVALFAGRKAEPQPRETVRLAWGAKVSADFRHKAVEIANALGIDPNWLMACIAFESAYTFRPDIRNAAGSGATGLIQFMPATARDLGTNVEVLARMSAEEQLRWVRKYFDRYKGRMGTLSDVYMAILWPAGIGKPENWVLWDRVSRPTTYRQNAGLDLDKDGAIRKSEAARHVQAALERGLKPGNVWEGVL